MPADPEQLGRGEARHGEITGDLVQRRDSGFQLAAFGGGPRVVPQDAGAEHRAAPVHQHRTVHLAGQADAAHPRQLARPRRPQRVHRGEHRPPPRLRVLLAPARARPRNVERFGGVGEDALLPVHQQRLHRGGAEVEP
jgi:hypothetical protein